MQNISITIIGLGKMGNQIAKRLFINRIKVFGWDISETSVAEIEKSSIFASTKIEEVVAKMIEPVRIFWLMIPHEAVDDCLTNTLGQYLRAGDIVIDGGNSFYKDSVRRAATLKEKGVYFFDCGTSGGIYGEEKGFALMVGGPRDQWTSIEPIIKILSSGDNYAYLGTSGAGHFTKMVHNGIEYGMMESIAEGYAVLKASPFDLNLTDVTRTYQNGSVIRSWLIDLCKDIFTQDDIAATKGIIDATGEGEWTINTGKELGVDVRAIESAYRVRQESQKPENQEKFSNKIVALLRKHFGGHSTHTQ